MQLRVSLLRFVTNPLLEFGLDFLDAHLRVVFSLSMKQEVLERGSSTLVFCRFVSNNVLTSL